MEYMIKTYSNTGNTVLDFTMGSGTTGVAAIKLLRKFIGIEKDRPNMDEGCDLFFNISCGRITEAYINAVTP